MVVERSIAQALMSAFSQYGSTGYDDSDASPRMNVTRMFLDGTARFSRSSVASSPQAMTCKSSAQHTSFEMPCKRAASCGPHSSAHAKMVTARFSISSVASSPQAMTCKAQHNTEFRDQSRSVERKLLAAQSVGTTPAMGKWERSPLLLASCPQRPEGL